MLASKSCTAAWRLARLEKGLLASFKVGCIAGPFRLCCEHVHDIRLCRMKVVALMELQPAAVLCGVV